MAPRLSARQFEAARSHPQPHPFPFSGNVRRVDGPIDPPNPPTSSNSSRETLPSRRPQASLSRHQQLRRSVFPPSSAHILRVDLRFSAILSNGLTPFAELIVIFERGITVRRGFAPTGAGQTRSRTEPSLCITHPPIFLGEAGGISAASFRSV